MAGGMQRTVHPPGQVAWGKLRDLAPGVEFEVIPTAHGEEPEEPMALRFTDPDGEQHIFPFGSTGKANLLAQMTGGVILPDSP